jgi:cell division GTPase FtsZ
MDDEMRVTVIATGFSVDPEKAEQTAAASANSAAKKAAVKKSAATVNPSAPAGTGSNINEKNDDDYFDIMTIFGRNNK